MGIQKMFAEGTNEFEKKSEWYEKLPLRTKTEKQVLIPLPIYPYYL